MADWWPALLNSSAASSTAPCLARSFHVNCLLHRCCTLPPKPALLACLQLMMLLSGCFFLLGAGLQAGAHSLAMLIVGRSILGFGVGERCFMLLSHALGGFCILCRLAAALCCSHMQQLLVCACTQWGGGRTLTWYCKPPWNHSLYQDDSMSKDVVTCSPNQPGARRTYGRPR